MDNCLDVILCAYKRISNNAKVAFMAAFAFGFFTHIAIITNKLTNWDDTAVMPDAGGGRYFGRWFMEKVFFVFDKWGSESFNGIMSILLLAVFVSILIVIFNIHSITTIVLIAALIVSFPSVLSNLTFVYMSPTFFVAIILATIAVFVTVRYKYGFWVGPFIMLFSLATYQAYFALATSILLLFLICNIIKGDDISKLWIEGIKYLLMLMLSLLIYFISIKFIGAELSGYRGMDNIGKLGMSAYFIAIARAYHRLLQYFVLGQPSYVYGFLSLMMYIVSIIILIMIVLSYIFMKKKDFAHIAALTAIYAIFPLAVSLVYVMAPEESNASTIMTFSYCIMLIFPLVIFEVIGNSIKDQNNKLALTISFIICIVMLLTSFAQYRMTNKAYYRTEVALERMTEYYNRLLYRIESTEGFEYGDSLAIVGDFYPENVPVSTYEMEKVYWEDLEGLATEENLFSLTVRNYFIRNHLGIDTVIYDYDEIYSLSETQEFKDMSCYPAEGCVQKINGVWVLKVAE